MNIKKRLLISNTITVVTPFIIAFIAAFVFMLVSTKVFNTDINYSHFKNLVSTKSELLNAIKNVSKLPPDSIENPEFQKYIYQKLSTINGEIIITKDTNVIFASKELSKIDIEKCLDEVNSKHINKSVKIDTDSYIVETAALNFKDDSTGNIILLAPIGIDSDIFDKFIVAILSIFILSFIAVNIFMSYLYSTRILEPIALLKKATAEISKGDLNFEIIENGDNEIRELCTDFERMRIQLKDSLNTESKIR